MNADTSSEESYSAISQALEGLGLSFKEARVYRKLIQMGGQPASVIARWLSLPRSSGQFLAEQLVKKHFLFKTLRKGITYYSAETPEKLSSILEQQKQELLTELTEKGKKLKAVIPLVKELAVHSGKMPKVQFLEGLDGIRTAYEDTLTAEEPIRTLVSFQNRGSLMPDYFTGYYQRRTEKGIRVRAIYPDTPFGETSARHAAEYLRDARLVDSDRYSWEPEVQFYDDKVVITSGKERIAVIIESKDISEAMKVLFDLAWSASSESASTPKASTAKTPTTKKSPKKKR